MEFGISDLAEFPSERHQLFYIPPAYSYDGWSLKDNLPLVMAENLLFDELGANHPAVTSQANCTKEEVSRPVAVARGKLSDVFKSTVSVMVGPKKPQAKRGYGQQLINAKF